jgi:hypothetical protein
VEEEEEKEEDEEEEEEEMEEELIENKVSSTDTLSRTRGSKKIHPAVRCGGRHISDML